MPEHQTVDFTCDARPGRRGCSEGTSVRLEQTELFIVAGAVLPDGWVRRGNADLCPKHVDCPTVNSLIWHTSSPPGSGQPQ